MKIIRTILLSLLIMSTASVCYAVNDTHFASDVEAIDGPIPVGKLISKLVKPFVTKAVKKTVKGLISKIITKKTGKIITNAPFKTKIAYFWSKLDFETKASWSVSGTQFGYEKLGMYYDVSTQVKSNMQDYLQKFKEEHQLE